MFSANKLVESLVALYFIGVPVCWSYLIAIAINIDVDLLSAAILLGWLPSFFWPLILLVHIWYWVLF